MLMILSVQISFEEESIFSKNISMYILSHLGWVILAEQKVAGPASTLNHPICSCTNDTNLIYGMEDWDMILSLVSSGCYGVVLPEKLISYRVRSNSMSRNFTKAKRLYSFRYISEKHKMELSKYSEDVAGLLHANGSGLDFDNPTMGHLDHYQIKIGPFSWQISSKIKNRIMASRTLSRAAFFMYQIVKRK
jgi:hypothetical protein